MSKELAIPSKLCVVMRSPNNDLIFNHTLLIFEGNRYEKQPNY